MRFRDVLFLGVAGVYKVYDNAAYASKKQTCLQESLGADYGLEPGRFTWTPSTDIMKIERPKPDQSRSYIGYLKRESSGFFTPLVVSFANYDLNVENAANQCGIKTDREWKGSVYL